MKNIDIRKKRPSRIPWIAGAILLVLVAWGVTVLLAADDEPEAETAAPKVEESLPPAAIPEPPYQSYGATRGRTLAAIAPLDEQDVGEMLEVEGQVVATGNDAFWLLSGRDVLRVESPRRVRKGDSLVVAGTLTRADPERTARMDPVLQREPASEDWIVVSSIKLVEEGSVDGDPGDAGSLPS